MSGPLAGMCALVVGGSSGIGQAVVEAYLAAGAQVTVLDKDAGSAPHRAPSLVTVVGDATDPEAVRTAVEATRRDGRPLSQLTLCAGIHDQYAALDGMTLSELAAAFTELYAVNVLSALLAVRAARDDLVSARGSVTLTLSEAAFGAFGGGVLYGSSKWALRGLLAQLARELAPHVRVNAVAPGGTSGTQLRGLSALGQQRTADEMAGRGERIAAGNLLGILPEPADHAPAYVYLAASTLSRAVSATVVHTDGGSRLMHTSIDRSGNGV